MPPRPAAPPPRPEVVAFLTDCKENPDDDTPRLVLADWLEERDDPRGTFVRLQCQRSGRGWALREDELLTPHRQAWLGVLDEKGIDTKMQRGLVEASGHCCKLLSKRFAALGEQEPFAWVDHLTVDGFGAADLPKLAGSPHWKVLTGLRIEKHVRLDDSLVDPATVGRSSGDWAPLANLGVLSTVSVLDLSCQGLGVAGATDLASAPDLRRLRTLHLNGNNLGNAGGAALAANRSLTGLTTLSLIQNRIASDGFAALAEWPALASVTKLSLSLNYPGDDGVTALAASPYLGSLTELWLNAEPDREIGQPSSTAFGERHLGPAGAAALARSTGLPRLARLDLAHHRIGPDGAAALAASTTLPALAELDLTSNAIGDAGVIALAESPATRGLTTLRLRHNGITDRGAAAILGSPYLAGLMSLGFLANWDTTAEMIGRLKARFGQSVGT